MRTVLFSIIFTIISALSFPIGKDQPKKDNLITEYLFNDTELLFQQMNLDNLIDFKTFESAYSGYKKLNKNNNSLLTIIDFNLPSTKKRMYVLDLASSRKK